MLINTSGTYEYYIIFTDYNDNLLSEGSDYYLLQALGDPMNVIGDRTLGRDP